MSNYSNEEKLNFREIVLSYLKKIIDLNLKIIPQNYYIEYVKGYRRAVLGLNDILLPFFDKKMEEAQEKYNKDFDIMINETTNKGIVRNEIKYNTRSLNLSRELFGQLNLLLHRNDYLKSSVYGEDKDEIVTEEEEE